MASKRLFTSYPWRGCSFKSPSTPYLSHNFSPVCIWAFGMSSGKLECYPASASGGRGEVRVVVDDRLVARAREGIETPTLRVRGGRLRQHGAGRVSRDEGA